MKSQSAITTCLVIICIVSVINAASTRNLDQDLANPGVPASGYINGELLSQLLSMPAQPAPSKRQWCMKGMTYNHVIGACTLSFAAMRGRGRGG